MIPKILLTSWFAVTSLVLLIAAGQAQAYDYGQGRGMGGAGVAAVADHSAIELNPAGISQLQRYSVGGLFYHQKNAAAFGFSIVDNKTSPMAMGVDYRNIRPVEGRARDYGALLNHRLTASLGEFYENKVHLGFQYKFQRQKNLGAPFGFTTTTDKDSNHNLGTGIVVPINSMLRFGLVSYDLLWFTKNAPDPRVAAGVAIAPHAKVLIVLDVIQITDSYRHWQAAAGTELIALDNFALRAGYHQDFYKLTERKTWSAGIGWFFPKGQISYGFNTEPGDRVRHTVAVELAVR